MHPLKLWRNQFFKKGVASLHTSLKNDS